MNSDSAELFPLASSRPILIVPYMWIGDFVRCHTVVTLLRQRWPRRPIDLLTSHNNAPLLDYMPGVRKGIICDLPRKRLPLGQHRALAKRLQAENYGTALIMLRTWKAALAPFLAAIPERVGFVGEGRFVLLNDLRWGERRLPRMIDRCASLALPKGADLPGEWPAPELAVSTTEIALWTSTRELALDVRPIVVLAPGAVGPGKRWPISRFAELARRLAHEGASIWVVGGPAEAPLASEIAAMGAPGVRDLTGTDLRNAILALKAADVVVSNDSGLMHVAAALGTPTVALFGPTDPRICGPLNPLAAILEAPSPGHCQHCDRSDCGNVLHRRVEDISLDRVVAAVQAELAGGLVHDPRFPSSADGPAAGRINV
jgi:heptosyltransferase II